MPHDEVSSVADDSNNRLNVTPREPAGSAASTQDFIRAGTESLSANGVGDLLEGILSEQRERWRHGDRVTARDYLVQNPSLAAYQDGAADLVYNEFILSEEAGLHRSFEDFLHTYPEYAGPLRLLHEADHGLACVLNVGTSPVDSSREIGKYDLLAEIGRGGMGVVYKAWHRQLKRPAALKMILAGSHAGAETLGRFRVEAEAIAQLQHPNVVQIYDIGEQDGRPYLALEFVDGGSLAKKFAGAPQPPGDAAALVRLLASGAETAHRHGVIHRDLKPGNVMLTADGTPKITDFGLAKRLDLESGQTHTGQVVGTPSYMAPEQASGQIDQIGPATDVYALGAILYEALTGRPPFKGTSPVDTLEQVRDREPVAIRQLQPRVPRDLETIAHKCLQNEAGKRYVSAAALAKDLGRFLDGEPILARPIGRFERLLRWCRRRPLPATLAAALIIAVAVGFAAVYWQMRRAEAEASSAQTERDTANTERQKAEVNLSQACDAVDFIGRQIGHVQLSFSPHSEEIRREMLEYAVRFYEGYLRQYGSDSRFRADAAKAYLRMGHLRAHLGDSVRAEDAFRQAIVLFESLAGELPEMLDHRKGILAGWHQLGLLWTGQGRFDKAEEAFRKMEAGLNALPKQTHSEPEYRRSRAFLHDGRAQSLIRSRQSGEAESHAQLALQLYQQLVEEFPAEEGHRRNVASALNQLAIIRVHGGRGDEALPLYLKSLEIHEQVAAQSPLDPSIRLNLGTGYRNLGLFFRRNNRFEESQQMYGRAEDVYERLTKDFPGTPSYHRELVSVLMWQAIVLTNPGDRLKKLSILQRARGYQRKAAYLEPKSSENRSLALNLLMLQAEILVEHGDHRGVVEQLDELPAIILQANDVDTAVRFLVRCAEFIQDDATLSTDGKQQAFDRCANVLAKVLRVGGDSGYTDPRSVLEKPELAPFRSHDAIRALLKRGE